MIKMKCKQNDECGPDKNDNYVRFAYDNNNDNY